MENMSGRRASLVFEFTPLGLRALHSMRLTCGISKSAKLRGLAFDTAKAVRFSSPSLSIPQHSSPPS